MKKKITYEPKFNFHQSPAITLIVDTEHTEDWWSGDSPVYLISRRQARRIENHFCGMRGCGCPKGEVLQLNQEGTEFGVPVRNCEDV